MKMREERTLYLRACHVRRPIHAHNLLPNQSEPPKMVQPYDADSARGRLNG